MLKKSPQVNAYINKLPDFSKKILTKLRQIIHEVDPEINEDIRWGSPAFFKKNMVFLMWAMQQHCSLIFQNGALIKDTKKLFNQGLDNKKNVAIKFTDVSEVSKIEKDLKMYIKEAIKNDLENKKIVLKRRERKPVAIPSDIKKLLEDENLLDAFKKRPYYQQRDYLHWITNPKQPGTRLKHMTQMVDELHKGGVYMGMKV